MYVIYSISLGLLAFLVWVSADLSRSIYLKSFCSKKTDQKIIAITFDDGPEPGITERVLDVLKKHQVKATFFLIGHKAELYPELVQRIIYEGHVIGNHTYSHTARNTISSTNKIKSELEKTSEILYQITGLKTKLFRPPFGVTNPMIGTAAKEHFLTIGWSIRSLDTLSSKTREEIYQRIIKRLHPGAVLLLHDRCQEADRLLELVLQDLESKKYTTTTVDNLFNIHAYEN